MSKIPEPISKVPSGRVASDFPVSARRGEEAVPCGTATKPQRSGTRKSQEPRGDMANFAHCRVAPPRSATGHTVVVASCSLRNWPISRPKVFLRWVLNPKSHILNSNSLSGQAMLLAILALNGALMGATVIAGFLMAYQIRAATDAANSAQAIFAADAGAECGLYNYFKLMSFDSCPPRTLLNGASYTEVTAINPANPAMSTILSTGFYRTARRALLLHN